MTVFSLNDKNTWSENVKQVVHYYKHFGLFDDDFFSDFVNDKIQLKLSKVEVEQIHYVLQYDLNSYTDAHNRQAGNPTNTPTIYKSYEEIVKDHYNRLLNKYAL